MTQSATKQIPLHDLFAREKTKGYINEVFRIRGTIELKKNRLNSDRMVTLIFLLIMTFDGFLISY